jgi:hypothetical protein
LLLIGPNMQPFPSSGPTSKSSMKLGERRFELVVDVPVHAAMLGGDVQLARVEEGAQQNIL